MIAKSITPSSGNVFADLGFLPEESALLKLRAQLMADLRETLAARGWTQTQAAQELGVSQSRISDLVRGKWRHFSLDMLITLAVRTGRHAHFGDRDRPFRDRDRLECEGVGCASSV